MCGVNETALAEQIAGLDVDLDAVDETVDIELQPEPLFEKNGHKVSKSPWGPDDEIGRLNWVSPESVQAITSRLNGTKVFDLSVEYWSGMPSWTEAGDPPFSIWMTHTPKGSILDGRSGYGPEIHEEYAYSGDSISMYTHCGPRTSTRSTTWATTARSGTVGRRTSTSGPWSGRRAAPIASRRSSHGASCSTWPPCTVSTSSSPTTRSRRRDLQDTAKKQGVEFRKGDVVLVRTGAHEHVALDRLPGGLAGHQRRLRQVALRGGRRDVHRRRQHRPRTAAVPRPVRARCTATCSPRRVR